MLQARQTFAQRKTRKPASHQTKLKKKVFGTRMQDTIHNLLKQHWEELPQGLRKSLDAISKPSPKEVMVADMGPNQVASEFKAAGAKLRNLGQKKLHLDARYDKLAKQLETLQEDRRKLEEDLQEAQQSLERITAVYANKVLRADFLEDEVPVLEPFGGEGKQQQLFRMVEAFGSRLTNGEKDKFKALVEEIFHEVPHDLKRRRKEEVLEAGDLGDPDAYMHREGGIGDQGFGPHLG